jgi:hypothetical protein
MTAPKQLEQCLGPRKVAEAGVAGYRDDLIVWSDGAASLRVDLRNEATAPGQMVGLTCGHYNEVDGLGNG